MKKMLIAVACVIALLIGFAGGIVLDRGLRINPPSEMTTPPEKADEFGKIMPEYRAKEIAVERADLTMDEVSFIKVERDFDDGAKIYDIEFVSGKTEYNVELMAETGEVVSFEQEMR